MMVENRNKTVHVFGDLFAGSCGATASVYVGQPLDTLKVKMQTFPHLYPNLLSCLKQTLRNDGFYRGLYAGTIPSLVANVSENGVLFAAYGLCQTVVSNVTSSSFQQHNSNHHLTPLQNGLSGFMAAFFSSFTLCPTELVKCRMQALRENKTSSHNNNNNIRPIQLTKQIFMDEGISGFFKGLRPTMAREMPGYFFFFYSYEFTRELLKPECCASKDDIGPARTIVSGGVAGMTLWTLIFPFDVLKSKMQVSGVDQPMWTCAKRIVSKHGFLSLYNGLLPTLLRTFPATGALFLTYEYSKRLFHTFCIQQ